MKLEGFYLVDKEAGWTSFDVVAKMRGLTGIKTIGHAGTLDPFASGLLIILVGKEFTKKQSEFMKQDKEYEATLKLDEESTTGDPEGEIKKLQKGNYTARQIEEVLLLFTGEITQRPPAYSAIKINGERAYKKARKGEDFEVPERKVTVYDIKMISYKYPLLKFKVKCSSGTYIRTLAMDIAKELGTKGYLSELRRTKIGSFHIKNAKNIKTLEKEFGAMKP